MDDIGSEAAFHYFELFVGRETPANVVSWADQLIRKQPEPPGDILDLSFVAKISPKEILGMLLYSAASRDGDVSFDRGFRLFVSGLSEDLASGTLSPDEAASILYRVAWKARPECFPSKHEMFCNWVADEFSLVRQGIKDRGSAEVALTRFLSTVTAQES